jgi:hypothetical protein
MGLLGALIGYTSEDAVFAFRGRAAGTSDVAGRLVAPFVGPWSKAEEAGLFGYGIGVTHQTAAAVTKDIVPYGWLPGGSVEVESGRVMLELGLVGFLLVYSVRIYLLVLALRRTNRLRNQFCRSLATGSVLFFLVSVPGAVVFDFVSGVYYWFFAGMLLLAWRLDSEAQPLPTRVPGNTAQRQAALAPA